MNKELVNKSDMKGRHGGEEEAGGADGQVKKCDREAVGGGV